MKATYKDYVKAQIKEEQERLPYYQKHIKEINKNIAYWKKQLTKPTKYDKYCPYCGRGQYNNVMNDCYCTRGDYP